MKITTLLLSYKRVKNLDKIIGSIKNSSVKTELIIINNNPDIDLKIDNISTINMGDNYGCMARHAIALLSQTSHCLFFDDDLMLEKDTIKNLSNWSKKLPESIIGYFGINLNRKDKNSPYLTGKKTFTEHIDKPKLVDIVLGRIHFCQKEKMVDSFKLLLQTPNIDRVEDDIFLSMSNNFNGFKNYVVPKIQNGGYINLPEGDVAISRQPGHINKRDFTIKQIYSR